MNMAKTSLAAKIRAHVTKYPGDKASEIANKFNVSVPYVYTIKSQMKKLKQDAEQGEIAYQRAITAAELAHKTRETWQTVAVMSSSEPLPTIATTEEPVADLVNHPAHYKVGGIETIDFIEAKGLGYHLGNAVKYITRADHKGNRRQDLEKARWYLDRAIEHA
jgi:hypothetical protein